MKLFGHDTSPYVRRVRALLHELGASYERDTAGWAEPSEAFLKVNPVARVPAMTVTENGKELTLVDSRTIAEFLLAKHGIQPSAKADSTPFQTTLYHPQHRYEDANVLTTIDAALDSEINIFLLERDGIKRESAPYLKRQEERVGKCMTWIDTQYASRATLHEDAFSFIDLALFATLDWFVFRKRVDVAGYRNLAEFMGKQRNRASLAGTDPRLAEDMMAKKK